MLRFTNMEAPPGADKRAARVLAIGLPPSGHGHLSSPLRMATVVVLTAQQAMVEAIELVDAIAASGKLNQGQANSLHVKLSVPTPLVSRYSMRIKICIPGQPLVR